MKRLNPIRHKLRKTALFCLIGLILPGISNSQDFGSYLDTNRPRLVITPSRVDDIIQARDTDPLLGELIEVMIDHSELALTEPLVAYQFDGPGDPRLKDQRRAAMFRIFNLGLSYRITGLEKYAERVRAELMATANFPDWASNHFLNVGEIAAYMGIGLDWIHDYLSEDDRAFLARQIINKGLKEGLKCYNGSHPESWWVSSAMNWNQVCNAGLVLSALAIHEYSPDTCNLIIKEAIKSIPKAMDSYKPDGAWFEGPTYWAYGTTYNGLMLAALETATDSLWGLQTGEGYQCLGKSGLYHIQTAGPTGLYFNYADAKTTLYFSPVLFWLSSHFNQPVYAWYERLLAEKDLPRMKDKKMMLDDTLDRFFALLVAWYNPAGQSAGYVDLPYDSKFTGPKIDLGAMRGGWTDDAVYLAFKGGTPQADHAHLDLGTFVLDALGERWAIDLGGDTYDALPGYFNFTGPRWQYYRLNNLGHNTLVIDNAHQNYNANSTFSNFYSSEEMAFFDLDLSDAYKNQASSVKRTYYTPDRDKTIVKDMLTGLPASKQVRWGMITGAEVELSHNEAILKQNGKYLKARVIQPLDATFEILSTAPPKTIENPNTGTRMIAFSTPGTNTGATILEVEFIPNDSVFALSTGLELSGIQNTFLARAFPNPFRDELRISWMQQMGNPVRISVFNTSGSKVHQANYSGDGQGKREHVWLGLDQAGNALPQGVYLVVVESGRQRETIKVIKSTP